MKNCSKNINEIIIFCVNNKFKHFKTHKNLKGPVSDGKSNLINLNFIKSYNIRLKSIKSSSETNNLDTDLINYSRLQEQWVM